MGAAPLLRRSIRAGAGISVTTIDELCTGFSWISMLDSTLALRAPPESSVVADDTSTDVLREDEVNKEQDDDVDVIAWSSLTGEGTSCGDGDDQSLGFFKMPGRFMGGDACGPVGVCDVDNSW